MTGNLSVDNGMHIKVRKRANRIKKVALSTLFVFTFLAVATVFLGIPDLNFGIWNQSEPVLLGLHVCAAFIGLSLGTLVWADPHGHYLKRISHPFVLIPLALAGWSFFVSIFHNSPGLTWFGAAETGDGAFWYLELAVIIAAGIIINQFSRRGSYLVGAVFAVTVFIVVMTVKFKNGGATTFVPIFFADYLAASGVCLAAIAVSFRFPRYRLPIAILGLLTGLAVVFASGSNTAIVVVMVIAPGFYAFLWLLGKRQTLKIVIRYACGLIFVSITAISLIVAIVDFYPLYIDSLGTPLQGPINSLLSRHRLVDIIVNSIMNSPMILIVGEGWGTYSEILAQFLPTEWVSLKDHDRKIEANWDAVLRVDFHSHNSFAETLHSVGIIGLVLLVTLFVIMPIYSRPRQMQTAATFAVVLSAIMALWFLLPPNLPVMALAIAGFANSKPYLIKINWLKLKYRIATFIMGLSFLLTLAAWQTAIFSKYAYSYSPRLKSPLISSSGKFVCNEYFIDFGRGAAHLLHRLGTFSKHIVAATLEGKNLEEEKISILRGLICASEAYADQRNGVRMLISGLNSRADFAFLELPQNLTPLIESYRKNWEARLKQLLVRAPGRTDLAAPYLMYLLKTGQEKPFQAFSQYLFVLKPESPISKWFSGLSMLNMDDQNAMIGLERMRESLRLGIERLIPVDKNLKAQLLEGTEQEYTESTVESPLKLEKLSIISGETVVDLTVEIATTKLQRDLGIKFRTSWGKGDGMLLTFSSSKDVTIVMKDIFLALDILFIDRDGRIVKIVENTIPRSGVPIQSERAILSVLKTKAGFVRQNGIKIGSYISRSLP